MKTTTVILSFLVSVCAFAQSTPPVGGSPTPPVPGKESKMTDVTGSAVTNPNETITDSNKGSIKTAHVFFLEPKDGATVAQSFKVKFGVEGAKVRPMAEDPNDMTSGHFHLVIDGKPAAAGEHLQMTKNSVHLMKGETETTLNLKPGKHTLTVQFGDGAHRSYGPKMSQTIQVLVK